MIPWYTSLCTILIHKEAVMNLISKFIDGSKQRQGRKNTSAKTVKNNEMTIEETIRRYEQQCSK